MDEEHRNYLQVCSLINHNFFLKGNSAIKKCNKYSLKE